MPDSPATQVDGAIDGSDDQPASAGGPEDNRSEGTRDSAPREGLPAPPPVSPVADATDLAPGSACPGGVPHGDVETRTRYASAAVAAGGTCSSQEQTRRCSDGQFEPWSADSNDRDPLIFWADTCVVLDPPEKPDPPLGPEPPAGAEDSASDLEFACDRPDAYEAFVARDGEQCWEFPTHNVSSPSDETPFEVNPGESYHEFYYAVPWSAGSVATRIRTAWDNEVMYFQNTFASGAMRMPGQVDRNVTGTVLGTNASLLAMGGSGGCNQELPVDVGLKLPDNGLIMVQWHVLNATGEHQRDRSSVQICTVPIEDREHLADLTLLGTEQLGGIQGFPTGVHEFGTACTNMSRGPITLLSLTPHMRRFGRRMTSYVKPVDGPTRRILDVPFRVDQQITYLFEPRVELQPNDILTTQCRHDNPSEQNVSFGQSASQELCYQVALSYPADALANGVISLIGAVNTCW